MGQLPSDLRLKGFGLLPNYAANKSQHSPRAGADRDRMSPHPGPDRHFAILNSPLVFRPDWSRLSFSISLVLGPLTF